MQTEAFKTGEGVFPISSMRTLCGDVLLSLWQRMVQATSGSRSGQRELAVVETLALGNRKQLQLISCSGQLFLVGSGADSVATIVRVEAQVQLSQHMDRKAHA